MDKARKIIIFSLTRTGCIEYTNELLRAFSKYKPLIIVNKSALKKYDHDVKTLKTYTNILNFIPATIEFFLHINNIFRDTKKENKDITIYLPAFHFWNYIIARQAKKKNIPCYLTVHDYKTHTGERSIVVEWIQRLTMKLVTGTVFLSQNEINKATADSFQNEKIFHLPHPTFKVSSLNNLAHSSNLKLLFLGRIKAYKGIDNLIEALEKTNNISLTIGGSGHIKNIDSNKITLLNNYIPEKEISRLLDTHHILILPYKEATQSGVVSLGISKNMVMIISNLPGLKEQLGNDSAIWCEANSQSILDAITFIQKSPEEYQKVKENIKIQKEKFKKKWEEKFEELIQIITK